MRGLQRFLSDFQSSSCPKAEAACVRRELAHIRTKLQSSPKLDGYQRKKYLAKLVFMHIQGYHIDVGFMEALSLASSMRDSEKQMVCHPHSRQGYLALTMLVHERSDARALVIETLRRDLASLRESHTCLALHALATIGTLEMAEELGESVLQLLVSATSAPAVTRKAALTLLHLVRKDPHCVNLWEWLDRIALLLQSHDYGVAQSVAALVTELARISPEACTLCYAPAVEQLHRIVTMGLQDERHIYHHVPVPWLQIKLLSLLQQLPPPDDAQIQGLLQQCLQHLLRPEPLQRPMVDVAESHARYAIYFEAVRLAMHLDTTSILVARAAVHLGRLLHSEQTNVRYLALETLTQLAHTLTSLDPLRLHLDTIVETLRDPDTSVCRRALELLYALCEEANAHKIVAQLLEYMPTAEASLRQDMALKVSLLVEIYVLKFDTALALLDMAGDKVGDTLWSRIAQTITNRPKVQAYAAARLLPYLSRAVCHEPLVKLGTYVLSEFGYLVADQPGADPAAQFELLHRHAYYCSPVTRSMLLSTYVKWYTQYPSLSPTLTNVLRQSRGTFDMEIHQRACEYVALIELHAQGVMDMNEIFDTLPPFPSQDPKPADVGPGLFRFSKRMSTMPLVVTVPRGEARQPTRADEARRRLPPILPPMSPTDTSTNELPDRPVPNDAEGDLLELSGIQSQPLSPTSQHETIKTPWAVSTDEQATSPLGPLLGPRPVSPMGSTGIWEAALRRVSLGRSSSSSSHDPTLALTYPGAWHESATERVACQVETPRPPVRVRVQVHNRSGTRALCVQELRVAPPLSACGWEKEACAPIEPGGTTDYTLELQTTACFLGEGELALTIVHADRPPRTLMLSIPVTVTYFVEPFVLNKEAFFEQWRTIGRDPLEKQSVFALHTRTHSDYVALMEATGFAVLAGLDPRPESLVMSGVLAPQHDALVVLVRFEPHDVESVARLTVRAGDEGLAWIVHEQLVSQLQEAPSSSST